MAENNHAADLIHLNSHTTVQHMRSDYFPNLSIHFMGQQRTHNRVLWAHLKNNPSLQLLYFWSWRTNFIQENPTVKAV